MYGSLLSWYYVIDMPLIYKLKNFWSILVPKLLVILSQKCKIVSNYTSMTSHKSTDDVIVKIFSGPEFFEALYQGL